MLKLILASLFSIFVFIELALPAELTERWVASASEKYQIIKKLGAGAFGQVYAVKSSDGTPFALKMIRQGNQGENDHLFLSAKREFERGQVLHHPRIICAYDFFIYEPQHAHCVVLEYVNGQNLLESPRGRLSQKKACKVALQLLEGLTYAASLQLYHIDLHPGNLMLTKRGNLKIIDLASFSSWQEYRSFALNEWSTDEESPLNDDSQIRAAFPLKKLQQKDLRLRQKLARFCYKERMHAFQRETLALNENSKWKQEQEFILLYLAYIHGILRNILELGKFENQDLHLIHHALIQETHLFLKTQGDQWQLDVLIPLFDHLRKTLPNLVKKNK